MPVRTYDPASVTNIVNGKLITGYSDDSSVTVERMTDTWTDQVGTDGYVTRAKSNDTRGTVTLNLTQTSPSNDDLQALATADEMSDTGAGPFLMRDASGRTICSGDTCWITKPPSLEFGRNVTNRQWVIRVANLVIFTGGND